ncbi:phospholipid transport system transporter-binding protein [Pseudomonas duriflava]|uniref:Phospholipid transport system transporter-binding protein n=1 Tax=Pseudomonas duriflava TaxID=459528 RepID=A0A562QF84_9PSED|nr:STAS domain-containing protein [Pseudomonas duriflava]TWI55401.1 phospholipid transport system transporter-binding protein [Pseudomonas duriflava]
MSRSTLSEKVPGVYALSGVLDHDSVVELRKEGQRLLTASTASSIVIDCEDVEHANSAGLSLLLAFQRDVLSASKTLEIWHLPDEMKQIAGVCGLLDILPLSH